MTYSRNRPRARALAADAKHAALRSSARLWVLAVLLLAYVVLASCGGGAASNAVGTSGSNPQAPSPPTLSSVQQNAAEKVYVGLPRTPAGFLDDPPPVGVTGSVATTHLKNIDMAPGSATRFEVCSDDAAQALAWSESRTASLNTYADLVETNSSARSFELVRVPRTDSSARLRHRVFRCAYVDRGNTDLGSDSGPAGTVNQRPFDAAALKDLAEYLWEFTSFNNADYVVLQSAAAAAGANEIAHAIDMARLSRGATVTDCDRIDLLRWTHTLNITSGALQRRLDTLSSFGTRRSNGNITGCAL